MSQSRPNKGVTAKFVHSLELAAVVSDAGIENATGAVAFLFLYFQSSKFGGIDWQVFCGFPGLEPDHAASGGAIKVGLDS